MNHNVPVDSPPGRKQLLLMRHRRNKRAALVFGLLILLVLGVWWVWWVPLLLGFFGWVAHEAWFADHLFYSPKADYQYRFSNDCELVSPHLDKGRLWVDLPESIRDGDTLVLAIRVKSSWLGRFLDPRIDVLGDQDHDSQVFERGVDGMRYLNLSAFASALALGQLRLRGRYCRLVGQPRLWSFPHPDYAAQRVMVIAPHADDAELAAYGLYSKASEAWIVTLTAGEIEAEHYQRLGLNRSDAARLKGRLRAWDSIAVSRWGGVSAERAVQLGYFCLQLPAMQGAPDQPVASREADLVDTRIFRQYNPFPLPGDDGVPSWNNLLADLRALLLKARPQVIVLPQPGMDPHPDHICATAAVLEALGGLEWQPDTLLGYANHLHDNDRWPMGDAHFGVALPPFFDSDKTLWPCSLAVGPDARLDKAMALGMMHDLQPPSPLKRQVRQFLQRWLAGRLRPVEGNNDFFRKAVRRQELFWRSDIKDRACDQK